jgi:hypothetical protein
VVIVTQPPGFPSLAPLKTYQVTVPFLEPVALKVASPPTVPINAAPDSVLAIAGVVLVATTAANTVSLRSSVSPFTNLGASLVTTTLPGSPTQPVMMAGRPGTPGTFLICLRGPTTSNGTVWWLGVSWSSGQPQIVPQGPAPALVGLPNVAGIADSGAVVCVSLGLGGTTQGALRCYNGSTFALMAAVGGTPLGSIPRGLSFSMDGLVLLVALTGSAGGVLVYSTDALLGAGPAPSSQPQPLTVWTPVTYPLLVNPRGFLEYQGGFLVVVAGGVSPTTGTPVTAKVLRIPFQAPYRASPPPDAVTPKAVGPSVTSVLSAITVDDRGSVFVGDTGTQTLSVFTMAPLCAAGSARNATLPGVCSTCTQGTYSAKADWDVCASCPAGWYSDVAGATRCSMCPAGR